MFWLQGTSKHATMEDYGRKLYDGVVEMQSLIACLLQQIASASKIPGLSKLQWSDARPGIKQLPAQRILHFPSDGSARAVVLFNPSGQSRTDLLFQGVDSASVCVRASNGALAPAQINPLYSTDLGSRQAGFELVSPVEVPAFAVKVVEIVRDAKCTVTMASV